MQNTVRTTIRIRKDLISQSRMIALKRGVSLQDVINQTLASGFKHITDFNVTTNSMRQIDIFRQSLNSKKINLKQLLRQSKADLR